MPPTVRFKILAKSCPGCAIPGLRSEVMLDATWSLIEAAHLMNTNPRNWNEYWKRLTDALMEPAVDSDRLRDALRDASARMPVPVIWLVGKTQAGKTSIIHALTGHPRAEIGNGFAPCTRDAAFFDYPEGNPLVRFLDTRGLGERDYDPAEDIRYCESRAHLVLAVMKVADQDQRSVREVLMAVRRRHPDWPVLVAQTGLHELYPPGFRHPMPWPFGQVPLPLSLPADLRRALLAQREALVDLPGSVPAHWVAVDLTLAEDGFEPVDYGLDALWLEIEAASSFGLREMLGADAGVRDLYARTAHQQIVGHALTAAGLGALPVVDLVAVTAVQAKLVHALARVYGQTLDRRMAGEFLGLVGAGIATGYVTRALGRTVAKLVPGWGQTIGAVWGASASGASTYALGKAAVYFFSRRRDGLRVDGEALRAVYREAMEDGRALLRKQVRR